METVGSVREAEDLDVELIQQIARKTWGYTYKGVIPEELQNQALSSWYSSESLRTQIPATTNRFLVAEDSSGRCVGFAQFVKHSAEIGELTRIYVLPDHHGQGFGFRLLQEGLGWLESEGIRTLIVTVEEQNPIGRRFYERTGFTEVRKETQDLLGHQLSSVLYRRAVT